MNLKRLIKSAAIAGVGLVLATTVSLAAQSTTSLNVRSGPNTSYRVVDVLYPGEYVNVKTCRTNGWCLIAHRGPDGWVSSRHLTEGPRVFSRYVAPVRPHIHRYPHQQNGITLRFGNGNFGFSIQSYDPAPECIRRFGRIYCR